MTVQSQSKLARDCCGKPQGCTNMNPGCMYLKYPYKRWMRGELSLVELRRRLLGEGHA